MCMYIHMWMGGHDTVNDNHTPQCWLPPLSKMVDCSLGQRCWFHLWLFALNPPISINLHQFCWISQDVTWSQGLQMYLVSLSLSQISHFSSRLSRVTICSLFYFLFFFPLEIKPLHYKELFLMLFWKVLHSGCTINRKRNKSYIYVVLTLSVI